MCINAAELSPWFDNFSVVYLKVGHENPFHRAVDNGLTAAGGRECASDYRYERGQVLAVSRDAAGDITGLFGLDERLVQLSDAEDLRRPCRARKEHQKREGLVQISSRRQGHDGTSECD